MRRTRITVCASIAWVSVGCSTAPSTEAPPPPDAGSSPTVRDTAHPADARPDAEATRRLAAIRAAFTFPVSPELAASLGGAASAQMIQPGEAEGIEEQEGMLVPRFAPPLRQWSRKSSTTVRLPRLADEPFVVESTGVSWHVRPLGAEPVAATSAGTAVVYSGARAHGSVIHVPSRAGTEEYIHYEARPASNELRYEVRTQGAAGYRLVEGVIEVLTSDGNPVLRTHAPIVYDRLGTERRGSITLEGCAFDTNPKLPWGTPATPPGSDRCVVVASWDDSGLEYPILVDPAWSDTGSMAVSRRATTRPRTSREPVRPLRASCRATACSRRAASRA